MVRCQECLDEHARCSLAGKPRDNSATCSRCNKLNHSCVPPRVRSRTAPRRLETGYSTRQSTLPTEATDERATTQRVPAAVQPPPTVDLYIAFDYGTSSTKCCVRVVTGGSAVIEADAKSILAEIEPIIRPNGESSVPSEIAWHEGRQIWGMEPSNQECPSGMVFRELKPVVFGSSRAEELATIAKIDKLEPSIRMRGNTLLRIDDIFSDFMGHTYRWVLWKTRRAHGDCLQWPKWRDADEIRGWKAPSRTKVHVSILLPVAATAEQQQRVLDAAHVAGIEEVDIVDIRVQQVIAVLDIGAGSVDLQVWRILSISPLRVEEMIGARTEWCGGSFVNKKGREIILHSIGGTRAINSLIKYLSVDKQSFVDNVESHFEIVKRQFLPPYSGQLLGITNLPPLNAPQNKNNRLTIAPDQIRKAYQPSLQKIFDMLQAADNDMRRLHHLPVDKIMLAGGGGDSSYLYEQIQARFGSQFSEFVRPTENFTIAAAKGALLLGAQESIIASRRLLRGYCVAWSKEAHQQQYIGEALPERTSDGTLRRNFLSKFLVQCGESVPHHHISTIRGGRAFYLHEVSVAGWVHEEVLYCCDKPSGDDLYVGPPEGCLGVPTGIDIHKMSSRPLRFEISTEIAKGFPLRVNEEGTKWYETEYEIRLHLEGNSLTWGFVLPVSGCFHQPEGLQTSGVIMMRGKHDISGNFSLLR